MRAAARRHVAPPAELPRVRALVLFRSVGALFVVLLGRSLYLQWMENDFLQGPGAGPFFRENELPAHGGRFVNRYGNAFRISAGQILRVFPKRPRRPQQLGLAAP